MNPAQGHERSQSPRCSVETRVNSSSISLPLVPLSWPTHMRRSRHSLLGRPPFPTANCAHWLVRQTETLVRVCGCDEQKRSVEQGYNTSLITPHRKSRLFPAKKHPSLSPPTALPPVSFPHICTSPDHGSTHGEAVTPIERVGKDYEKQKKKTCVIC